MKMTPGALVFVWGIILLEFHTLWISVAGNMHTPPVRDLGQSLKGMAIVKLFESR